MSQIAVELHSLIQNMPLSERRSFIKLCNLKKLDSNSLALFNAYCKLKKYDEEELVNYLTQTTKTKLVENLSSETTILFKFILKVLNYTVELKPIEDKLKNDFSDIKLLLKRGCLVKHLRKLKKLKKDAEIYDQKELLLQIYRFERETRRLNKEHKYLDAIEEIYQKEKELKKAIDLEIDLMHIYDQVFYLVQKFGILKKGSDNKLLAKMETALSKIDRKQCNCFGTQLLYFGSMEMLCRLKSDIDTAFKYTTELYQLYEKHTAIRESTGNKYIKFLTNHLNYLIRHNVSTDEFSEVVAKMKNIKLSTYEEETLRFRAVAYLEFRYYLNQGDFEKLEYTLPTLLEGLKKYGDKINLGRKTTLWYNIMISSFLIEDFDSANFWIQEIQDKGDKSKRLDLLNNSKLFELLVNYELGKIQKSDNSKYLLYLIRTVKRNFKDADNSNEVVNLITEMITAHCNKAHLIKKDFDVALKKFKNIDKTQNINLPYDEIEIWLRSKVQKQSMQKITEDFIKKNNE